MKKLCNLVITLCEKGAFYIFVGSFLTKLVLFFGSIFLVRILNKWEYGVLGYIENIYSYIFIFAGFGLSNSVLRYVVLGKKTEEKYAYFSYAIKKGTIFNIFLILIASIALAFYPHPDIYRPYIWLLIFFLFSLPFHSITDIILCNERAMFKNKRFAILSFFLSTAIIIAKLIAGQMKGITGVIIGQTILYLVLAVLFLNSNKKRYYKNLKAEELSAKRKKEVNIYSIQYMITNGLWAIFMLNDTFLLARFASNPTIIADFKVAYVLPGSVSLISSAIGVFIAPYFVRHENESEWIKRNFLKVYIVTAGLVGSLCLLLVIFARPLVTIMYGEQYKNIVGLMRILIIGTFLNCGLRFTTANILAAMGQIKCNMTISLIGMIMQVVINLKIIPLYGAVGIAVTSIVVYSFMAISLLIFFIKHYYTR